MTSKNIKDIPPFIYGTAWKEETTKKLTQKALSMGFSAIDTANQPRHYQEHLVGEALATAECEGTKREALFLQTKFTPANGHDRRIPYDPSQDIRTQVKQSFQSSLQNLHTDYVDAYLLHGPYSPYGLIKEDWEAWGAIEEIYKSGKTKLTGVSNVNQEQLELLLEKAEIKPMVVQNRCFAIQGWDKSVRESCRAHGVIYQGFSLLTANLPVLQHPHVQKIAQKQGITIPQVIFRFAIQIGILPLTGTTDEQHMKEDLEVLNFELLPEDIEVIHHICL